MAVFANKRAFVIGSTQSAVATHAKPEDSCGPAVAIMSMCGALLVSGIDDLRSLRDAVNFAIDGPERATPAAGTAGEGGA